MTSPVNPNSNSSTNHPSASESPQVIYDLYKQATHHVVNLDLSDPKQKELSNWFSNKLVTRFRQAHDLENNNELKQDLEEFIDNVQKATKKGS